MKTIENKTIQELSQQDQSPYPILSVKGRKEQSGSPFKGVFGFTLVELIIVITILAILATIAFMSFQGYAKQSRDSNRLTTIKTIEKGVDLFLTKSGKIPAPDEATAFTGGSAENPVTISQGTVGAQMVQVINMNQVPLDPKSQSKYHYSVFGETPYYQIGIEQEQDGVSYISPTFADSEEVMISGNYTFDPILPSLFVVKDSVVSGGLFGSGVCFVLDGEENTFESQSVDCLKKGELNLSKYEQHLVGYWDMEQSYQSGSKIVLKDLSGKGYDLTGSGFTQKYATGGRIGQAIEFNGEGLSQTGYYESVNSFGEIFSGSDASVSLIFKKNTDMTLENTYKKLLVVGNGPTATGFLFGISQGPNPYPFYTVSFNDNAGTKRAFVISKYPEQGQRHLVQMVFGNGVMKMFLDGKLVGKDTTLPFGTKTLPLRIGFAYNREYFNGIIDDIKIYTRALSDQEILQQAKIAGF